MLGCLEQREFFQYEINTTSELVVCYMCAQLPLLCRHMHVSFPLNPQKPSGVEG